MDTETTINAQAQTDKTAVVPAPGIDATVIGAPVVCPVCKTENAPTEKYCGECGFLLSSMPGEEVELPDTSGLPALVEAASGREHFLRYGENTIGREGTDVLLYDNTVSRRHAILILEKEKAWLEDAGSTNGTFVAGSQLNAGERAEVTDGAEIKFASVVLYLRLPSTSQAAEPGEPVSDQAVIQEEQATPEPSEMPEMQSVPAPPPIARLIPVDNPGHAYDVFPGTNTIGRRPGNSILLDDAYVSGSHAEILADDEGFWLTDVGSTNGTILNGEKLIPAERKPLGFGDKITLGRVELEFRSLEQSKE